MKRLAMIASLAAVLGGSACSAQASLFDPNLEAALTEAGENGVVSALVYLVDQVNLPALTDNLDLQRAALPLRHEVVVRALQERAADTQGDLLEELEALRATGAVLDYQPYWIANCIRVDGVKRAIELIAGHEAVDIVYYNYPIELIEPVVTGDRGKRASGVGPEIGLEAIRAPEVWAMGITGERVLVATLDTGVDGYHPALASRWRGLDPRYEGHPEWAFFDPVTHWQFPHDSGSHGTHTMGTVCGGAPGDEIGVAPGAKWIHAAVIDRVSVEQTVADAILAFQWLIDPDGDPSTHWDVPDVCSNSWGLRTGHGYPPCDEKFWAYLDACEAAGIVILFSAGNEDYEGLRRPADRATDDYRTCAVAAVDANDPNWPIADFSSRGPTYCTPDQTAAIKPDIAAPGVDVRSSVPGGGYGTKSGTSMASPHVNGVVALMREACPDLAVEDIKQIIYETAYDLGSAGEDNDYGWGMIDAYEAVNLAMEWLPSPPKVFDAYYEVPVGTPTAMAMQAIDYDGGPEEVSCIITSLPVTGHTLADMGNDHIIQPYELPYTLVDHGNEVLYTPSDDYYGDDEFHFKATDGGEPPDGGESEEATVSILVLFDPPEIITESLPDGYLGVPYGPVALEVVGGQPELAWSLTTDEYVEVDLEENQFQTIGNAMNWHSDDDSWNYSLPFAFPFYGELYANVWVCSNGFLDFASSDDEHNNSDAGLIANTRIAPMWDDLRTDIGGDIYIDTSSAGQVTFRWDTVTWADNSPCSHSCTLHEDGTIEFHYGDGNTPISPTVGISRGNGQVYLLSQYNDVSDLGDADSLRLYQPAQLPEGLSLSPDGTVSGIPVEAGSFDPGVKVTDSLERSDKAELPLIIHDEGLPGDVDGDGDVDTEDLLALLAAWGDCPDPPDPCPADFNDDQTVNTSDLLILLANWG